MGPPGFEIEQRSLVTVTTLAALGREAQLHTHLHGALNLGWTQAQLEEVFLHLAHYARWPAAVTALTVLGNVVTEREAEA